MCKELQPQEKIAFYCARYVNQMHQSPDTHCDVNHSPEKCSSCPGTTTEQIKFNHTIRDCNNLQVSSLIPAKKRTVLGPTVFSGTMGIPEVHSFLRTRKFSWTRNCITLSDEKIV